MQEKIGAVITGGDFQALGDLRTLARKGLHQTCGSASSLEYTHCRFWHPGTCSIVLYPMRFCCYGLKRCPHNEHTHTVLVASYTGSHLFDFHPCGWPSAPSFPATHRTFYRQQSLDSIP